jgi:uncharacterized membrane-anchored protein
MASAGEVLLKLLDHADADTLEVLLKAENLLLVMRRQGWTDDQVKRALVVDKKIPGELLLDLFKKGVSAKEMLGALGHAPIAEPSVTKVPVEQPRVKGTNMTPPPAAKGSTLMVIGIFMLLITMMLPALLAFGIPEARRALMDSLALTVGAIVVGGALSGLVLAWRKEALWIGAICGVVCALGGNVTLYFYSSWRSSLWNVEIAFVLLIGALPSVFLYHFLKGKA